jgi:hypothetical protein
MRTYLEFLILLSIGASKKNQLLSLLAEIYLYDFVSIGEDVSTALSNYRRIFDGLISGMWKYMCYAQGKHPLKFLCEKLAVDKKNKLLGLNIDSIFEDDNDVDKNEHIAPLGDDIGMLIFSMAYSLWFMFKKYRISYMENGELVDLEKNHPREFYYKRFKDLRIAIAAQVETSTMAQDMQTLRGFQSKAKELIIRYNSEIAEGKRQAKKEDGQLTNQTFNITNSTIIGSNLGGELFGDINSTNSTIDIKALNGILKTVIEEAEKNNIPETAELKAKIDELRKEATGKFPNKEKVKAILDWMHKLTAIPVAILNLYKFFAPFLGVPLLP